jgi:hypothetical protein
MLLAAYAEYRKASTMPRGRSEAVVSSAPAEESNIT